MENTNERKVNPLEPTLKEKRDQCNKMSNLLIKNCFDNQKKILVDFSQVKQRIHLNRKNFNQWIATLEVLLKIESFTAPNFMVAFSKGEISKLTVKLKFSKNTEFQLFNRF